MNTREQIIKAFEQCLVHGPGKCEDCYQDGPWFGIACWKNVCSDVLALLKEQEAEIRQLRLALDIAKGTCKGIVVEGR